MIFYFSGTGNSKYVAERIAKTTEDRIISIEKAIQDSLFDYKVNVGERIGFVSPTYYYGLPKIVEKFLAEVQLDTEGRHFVYLVLTMGGSTGHTGKSFRQMMAEKGLHPDALFSVKFPDTWTPLFDLSDRKKVEKTLAKADPAVEDICRKIASREKGDFDRNKGFWRFFSKLTRNAYYGQTTEKFAVSNACVSCGLCVSSCPDSAMKLENGKPVWVAGTCDFCLRCLHRCPQFAISFGKSTQKHGQYVNPKVKI